MTPKKLANLAAFAAENNRKYAPPPSFEGWTAWCDGCDAERKPEAKQEHDAKTGAEYYDYVCPVCASILLTIQREEPNP